MNDDTPEQLIERALGEQVSKRSARNPAAGADRSAGVDRPRSADEQASSQPDTPAPSPARPIPGRQISLEETLKAIDRRQATAIDSRAAEASAASTTQAVEQLLVRFEAGSVLFAVPMPQVAEIAERPAATRVPSLPHFLPGVVNLRGEIVVLFDLPAYMMKTPARDDCSALVIHGSKRQPIAVVLVDSVHGIAPFSQDAMRQPSDATEHALTAFNVGALEFAERNYSIVDLLALLTDQVITAQPGISS